MLNANNWQAAADVINVVLAMLFIAGAAVMWRLRGSFVTREEHVVIDRRIEVIESDIASIKGEMFTNADAKALQRDMNAASVQAATLIGALPEIRDSMKALAHQVGMLNQHALNQAGKH